MPNPVTTVTLGGTDISAYVGSAGGVSLTYSRGANFDGSSEGPGTAVISVQNSAKTFNPANAGSSLASVLKIGKEVRVSCVYSATTYGMFHGYLRRIIPLENGFAELHCEDALWKYGRATTAFQISQFDSYTDLRGALLNDVLESIPRRLLGTGIESSPVLFGTGTANALAILEEVNRVTGSIHWIDPVTATSPGYVYHVRDRADLQTAASVETFTDTDLATPFPVQLGGYDYTDEAVVNSQRVVAHPYTITGTVDTVLWESEEVPFTTLAGDDKDVWVDFDGEVFDPVVNVVNVGPGTVLQTIFSTSALLTFSGGASDTTWTRVWFAGQAIVRDPTASATSTDATSITDYGVMAGSDVDSDIIPTTSEAKGLGDWIVYRYKNPQARPTMTIENRFPGMVEREPGDRITLTSSVYSISARSYFIRHLTVSISDSGHVWHATYQLEEAPAVVSAFTIGGSAAQGVGGSGILGY